MTEEENKQCEFCGESILAIARKCKHCGSMLEGDSASSAASSNAPAADVAETSLSETILSAQALKSKDADYGLALLAIPVVATLLIVFWIGNMNLFQDPGSKLNLIMVIVLVGTAGLASYEASKLGMKRDSKNGVYGPVAWFILHIGLWIVAYPAYLFKRRKFGKSSFLVPGIAAMVVYIGAHALMATAINDKVEEIQTSLRNFE